MRHISVLMELTVWKGRDNRYYKLGYQHIYMGSRKTVQMNLFAGQERDADIDNRHVDTVGMGRVTQTERAGLTYIYVNYMYSVQIYKILYKITKQLCFN